MEFRLLTEVPVNHTGPSFELEGRQWSVTQPLDIVSEGAQIPEYTCVSYVWGSGRAPNPMSSVVMMSDHTLPALRTVLRNHPCRKIWQDIFCVPIDRHQKRATLESMGFIYGQAAQVIAVLSENSLRAFDVMAHWNAAEEKLPDFSVLDIFEKDSWIRSVWTYQEVANSKRLYFVGENVDDMVVDGSAFLNSFGHFLHIFKKRDEVAAFQFRARYPFLDSFEDALVDWMIGDFRDAGRSALQVLSSLCMRVWQEEANYFYAIIGTVTRRPSQRTSNPTIETLADAFMTICEDKGDYSFIFCCNERDTRKGYAWRPARQILRPILAWTLSGEAQPGDRNASGTLVLKGLALQAPSSCIGDDGKEVLRILLCLPSVANYNDEDLKELMLEDLYKVGFSGRGAVVTMAEGLFFPQELIPPDADVQFWVSTSVTWPIGAPGLAVVCHGESKAFVPGAYLGHRLDKTHASDLLIHDAMHHGRL
jgi:Heterokaryon incompatibility protein (HET)